MNVRESHRASTWPFGKLAAIAAAVSLVAALGAAGAGTAQADEQETTPPEVTQGDASQPEAVQNTITIIHTSDSLGQYKASDTNTGYSQIAALKAQEQPDLLLDAGGTFHGLSFATITKGESIASLMQQVGYDAITPGDRDFNYGAQQLKQLESTYGLTFLGGNVVNASDGTPFFGASDQQYLVKSVELEDGTTIKVGVIGVIDPALYDRIAAAYVEDVAFETEGVTVAQCASELAATARTEGGCDLVVCLAHSTDPTAFAAATTGIDAVVAGHLEIEIDQVVTSADGRDVVVVEADKSLQQVGQLTLTVQLDDMGTADDPEDDTLAVTGHTQKFYAPADLAELSDSAVDALVETLDEQVGKLMDVKIGTSSQEYEYSWEALRSFDNPLGYAVTTAYLNQTGSDIAFENAGGIRSGIPQGDVTAGDIVDISPYGNELCVYELTGEQILSILNTSYALQEQCWDAYSQQMAMIDDEVEAGKTEEQARADAELAFPFPQNSGDSLQVGGLVINIDPTKPAGQRVVGATITGKNGQPATVLDPDGIYDVAMNSYIPQLTQLYPELANIHLVQNWGSCEQTMRSFIAQPGWENHIAAIGGSVHFVDLEWDRLAGDNRLGTMKSITEAGYETADTVLIATALNDADALAASGLSGVMNAPVIITMPWSLSTESIDEIERLGAKNAIILGGEAAVTSNVEKQLKTRKLKVSRIAGETRLQTALGIYELGAKQDVTWGDTCIVAKGWVYADSLAAGSFAYVDHAPIFLANPDGSIPSEVQKAVKSFDHVVVLGGTQGAGAIIDTTLPKLGNSVLRIAGATRYETASQLAIWACGENQDAVFQPTTPLSWAHVSIAFAWNYPDALVGVNIAGPQGGPTLLVSCNIDDATWDVAHMVSQHSEVIYHGYVLGGSAVISDSVLNLFQTMAQ